MNRTSQWPYPPHWAAPPHPAGLPADMSMMVGEMRADLRRTVEVVDRIDTRIDRIDQRLAQGDQVMTDLSRRISTIEQRPQPPPPPWVSNSKWALTYLLPLLVFLATGNADLAREAIKIALGAK